MRKVHYFDLVGEKISAPCGCFSATGLLAASLDIVGPSSFAFGHGRDDSADSASNESFLGDCP
jgi:hypothetical protein